MITIAIISSLFFQSVPYVTLLVGDRQGIRPVESLIPAVLKAS